MWSKLALLAQTVSSHSFICLESGLCGSLCPKHLRILTWNTYITRDTRYYDPKVTFYSCALCSSCDAPYFTASHHLIADNCWRWAGDALNHLYLAFLSRLLDGNKPDPNMQTLLRPSGDGCSAQEENDDTNVFTTFHTLRYQNSDRCTVAVFL